MTRHRLAARGPFEDSSSKSAGINRSPDLGLGRSPFHSLALTAWLAAAVLPSLLTSNPVYLGLGLALVGWTHRQVAKRSPSAAAWGSFARFALFFVVFTLIFNVLMGGAGTTVLIELPAWRVTGDQGATLFQIGGPVTLESLAAGSLRAIALLLVIYALATFNALADHSQLLRGLPRWLDQAATILSIAIAFMPQLVAAQRDIREALALRGHRLRKLRDFLPLIVVLLDETLERAMGLAESMEARGYSGPPLAPARRRRPRWLIAGGLLLIGAGSVSQDLGLFANLPAVSAAPGGAWLSRAVPWGVTAAGGAMIVAALRLVGGRNRRTRYRRELWRPRDTALAATSVVAAMVLVGSFLYDRQIFSYPIFPRLRPPTVAFKALLPLLALLGPLVFHPPMPQRLAAGQGGDP